MSVNDYFASAYAKANAEEREKNSKLAMMLFRNAILTANKYQDSDKIVPRLIYQDMLRYAQPLLNAGWEWVYEVVTYRGNETQSVFNLIPEIRQNREVFGLRTGIIGMINWTDGRLMITPTGYNIRSEIVLISLFEGTSIGLHDGYLDWQDYTKALKGNRVSLGRYVDLDPVVSKLYGFEVSVSGIRSAAQASMTDIEVFLNLTHFFGNGMEEVLRLSSQQTYQWLYRIFSEGVYPGKPCESGSLKKLLKVNKGDLKYFVSQDEPDRLLFYMLARQKNGCSVTEAMRAYDRIIKITDKYQLDDEYGYYERNDNSKNIRIYCDHGRRILACKALPICLRFYSRKKLAKVISVNKYLRYLIDERKKNEDVQLNELEQNLEDYNRMLKEILPAAAKRFELPYNIVNAHNTMVTNYNAVVAEGGAEMDTPDNVEKLCRNYNDFWNTYTDGKYIVKRPMLPSEIHREGSELCHCVGTYTRRVLSGDTHIFFVRKKNCPDKPLVTLEVDDTGRILQQRGKGNRMTTAEESFFITNWAAAYRANMAAWKAEGKRRDTIFSEEASKIIEAMRKNKETAADKIRTQLKEVTYLNEETGAEL